MLKTLEKIGNFLERSERNNPEIFWLCTFALSILHSEIVKYTIYSEINVETNRASSVLVINSGATFSQNTPEPEEWNFDPDYWKKFQDEANRSKNKDKAGVAKQQKQKYRFDLETSATGTLLSCNIKKFNRIQTKQNINLLP